MSHQNTNCIANFSLSCFKILKAKPIKYYLKFEEKMWWIFWLFSLFRGSFWGFGKRETAINVRKVNSITNLFAVDSFHYSNKRQLLRNKKRQTPIQKFQKICSIQKITKFLNFWVNLRHFSSTCLQISLQKNTVEIKICWSLTAQLFCSPLNVLNCLSHENLQ